MNLENISLCKIYTQMNHEGNQHHVIALKWVVPS